MRNVLSLVTGILGLIVLISLSAGWIETDAAYLKFLFSLLLALVGVNMLLAGGNKNNGGVLRRFSSFAGVGILAAAFFMVIIL
ncbi:hypothetical protein ACFOLA_02520 [Salinicoccus hispanicus]|uniref:DUF3953 domain-containing protein n=1 Tax=Salinicoccus hispanicus TaxID=157225 RepID=A0A6N8TWY9_9STAP|nr:hypothetical protein [Salinicoccus hispanicus]MXQ50458.1 hypothetical protein [Salinicoccus hispanicus]